GREGKLPMKRGIENRQRSVLQDQLVQRKERFMLGVGWSGSFPNRGRRDPALVDSARTCLLQRLDKFERRGEPILRRLRQGPGKNLAQAGEVGARHLRERLRRLLPDTSQATAPNHLVDDRGEAEYIRAPLPRGAIGPLGRGIRPP